MSIIMMYKGIWGCSIITAFHSQALYRKWNVTDQKQSIKVFHTFSERDLHITYPSKAERYRAERDNAEKPHIYKNTVESAGVGKAERYRAKRDNAEKNSYL